MSCGDLNELLLTNSRGAARCASARGANFAKARLSEAKMAGIDLREAKLEEAQLDGAQLAHALMSGASFANARLDRADLTGAWLHGANFLLASLQGADLSGAKLQMADFTSAGMQGANLSLASLEGAVLRDAELEGASLRMASLQGADMTGAKMQGSDLAGAHVWRTTPPGGEIAAFSDMAQILVRPPSEDELTALGASLAHMEDGPLKARLADSLAGAHRPRPERELGHLARSAAVAGPRQVQRRSGRRRGLQGSPHRVTWPGSCAGRAMPAARWRPALPGAPWRRASRATCPRSTTSCAAPTVRPPPP